MVRWKLSFEALKQLTKKRFVIYLWCIYDVIMLRYYVVSYTITFLLCCAFYYLLLFKRIVS